jgi:hypothetical protein
MAERKLPLGLPLGHPDLRHRHLPCDTGQDLAFIQRRRDDVVTRLQAAYATIDVDSGAMKMTGRSCANAV